MTRADDIQFARELHNHSVGYDAIAWPRINELHRSGLIRVKVLTRYVAEIEAIGDALPMPPKLGPVI